MNILAELRSRFASALQPFTDHPSEFAAMVKPAQDSRFGDFQANCAMPLANRTNADPRKLADEIVAKLKISDLCQEPLVAGPGFINLTLRDDWLEAETNRLLADEHLGVRPTQVPRTYVVDYSAPNVAKPMHVGHLRSTVIGAALCRILEFSGHKVIGDNHIGDWGTQFGMIIFGYKNFLDREAFQQDAVGELARLYRLVSQLSEYHVVQETLPRLQERLAQRHSDLKAAEASADSNDKKSRKNLKKLRSELSELQAEIAANEMKRDAVDHDPALKKLADAHPDVAAQARNETAKLHAADPENRRLWAQFLPKCLAALQIMYDLLDISFDLSLGESHYQPMLAGVVDSLQAKGIARESEGAICVFLEGNDAPFIVRKGDGAFTYATTDLATIKNRVEEFAADVILYVVDARQSEHFKLLFGTARRWGLDETECRHISFGTILGDDKRPFKTRSGDTVGLESLIEESIARARKIIDENDDAKRNDAGQPAPELDEASRAMVAEIVGIGGIKYADLRHNRESDYVFSWDKMLATSGDTATYMQYAYARICGIFRKGQVDRESLLCGNGRIRLSSPEERGLALQLCRFAEAIDEVLVEYRPNILTQHLFETANRFTDFFHVCPVLKAKDEPTRCSRLLLCELTARSLSKGLWLLGIQTSERM